MITQADIQLAGIERLYSKAISELHSATLQCRIFNLTIDGIETRVKLTELRTLVDSLLEIRQMHENLVGPPQPKP